MAKTEVRGGEQIRNLTIPLEDLVQNFLGGSDWNITNGAADATITGLKDGVNAADAVNKSQLDALESLIGNPMRYKGGLDASTPNPDLDAIDNEVGDFYKITVAGTYLGIEWAVNDSLILNKDVASGTTITGADVDKIDNTEAPDILRTSDVVDNLTSTGVTDAPLSANQGFVLKGLIDSLSANVKLRKYGEALTITHNSAVLPALANSPVSSTVRVYYNGLRMQEGSGNDYTVTGSVITFEYTLKNPSGDDKIIVDYEY